LITMVLKFTLLVALNYIIHYTPASQAQASVSGYSDQLPPLETDTDPGPQTCGLAPPFCLKSRYRTIDGSCNNLIRPKWGIPQTPYGRLVPHNYADGVHEMPRSTTGRPLPNPRAISLRLYPDKQLVDPIWNLNAQQWGQIITHDMSLTDFRIPPSRVRCCETNGRLSPNSNPHTNPHCATIMVPPDDPIHAPQGTQCMNFERTVTTRDRRCTPPGAPAEQLTVVTAYMDLSLVYGSSEDQAAPIRAGSGGRLLTDLRNDQEWPPQHPNITLACQLAQTPNERCYLVGDFRANQNPQLTVLHIVLVREHNRIADYLAELNPHWSDEKIFQEARRIHIAEIQHINYYEHLPIFL
ncbi:peroxidase-like, partial [Hyposmocoma kahamanoa]|uniref:peroxidase-like n=1 Tax=Hyposmocoma kahamanoa TaxID=1477025 RepID=UPI000E6D7E73